jgi:hypothetical protein
LRRRVRSRRHKPSYKSDNRTQIGLIDLMRLIESGLAATPPIRNPQSPNRNSSKEAVVSQLTFPPLPLDRWQPTRDTLAVYARLLGKSGAR